MHTWASTNHHEHDSDHTKAGSADVAGVAAELGAEHDSIPDAALTLVRMLDQADGRIGTVGSAENRGRTGPQTRRR